MEPQDSLDLTLSRPDVVALIGAVQRFLRYWERHYADDGHATHSESEDAAVRRRYSELLWRLETALTPRGHKIQHSERAMQPAGASEDGRVHSTVAEAEAETARAPHGEPHVKRAQR